MFPYMITMPLNICMGLTWYLCTCFQLYVVFGVVHLLFEYAPASVNPEAKPPTDLRAKEEGRTILTLPTSSIDDMNIKSQIESFNFL